MLNRTKLVLDKAKKSSDELTQDKELIQGYLTEYILIVFYAEVEEKIKIVLHDAISKASNESIAHLISNSIEIIAKRLCKKDLAKTVKYFGKENLEKFNETVDEQSVQRYGNFIANRHCIAHPGQTVSVSWIEIQEICTIGEHIIGAFKEALDVSS